MSVMVKIREARVDYDTADHFQEEEGKLYVFADGELVGLHNQYEWTYAAVKNGEPLEIAATLLNKACEQLAKA
jgi:hypothetical protein